MIALGVSIGSGEFLLGPAAFVKYGLSLLWVVGVAALLQTLLNVELMRYTMATGEPIVTGFMRMRPHSTFWAWFYAVLYFLQMGWPGWAGAAAGAVFFLFAKRLPGAGEAGLVYGIGVGLFLMCGLDLDGRTANRANTRISQLDHGRSDHRRARSTRRSFRSTINLGRGRRRVCWVRRQDRIRFNLFLPAPTSSCSVRSLPTRRRWRRKFDVEQLGARQGLRNEQHASGSFPRQWAARKLRWPTRAARSNLMPQSLERWRGWWRIMRVDQWGVYFTGAVLGMVLPALLYVTFVPAGSDIRGLGIAAALAQAVATQKGAIFGGVIAVLGVWILFKTQLDILEGMTRAITDILWTGSARIRAWRGGDVRVVYYSVLVVISLWGIVALRLTQPIILLSFSANMAGIVFIISSLHLLYVNTRLLPVELRPPMWRRLALVALALFYGLFLTMWVWSAVMK